MMSSAHDTAQEEKEKRSKGKEKRKRRESRDSDEEQQALLEKAESKLLEAEKKRDLAKRERDLAKAERDKYRDAYFTEQDPERRVAYKVAWDDAEAALHTAQSAIDAQQEVVNTQYRTINRFTELALPPSPGSSSSQSSSQGRASKKARGQEGLRSIQEFWKHLHLAKFDKNKRVLELAEETHFLGNLKLGHRLFVRQHYEGLLNRIQGLYDEPLRTAFGVVGTPGIGKTYFLYWLLWKLRMRDDDVPHIVLETVGETYLFSHEGGVVVATDTSEFKPYLKSTDCWYLVDGKKPSLAAMGPTVLATSPKRSNWYDFEKQAATSGHILYMPLFTQEEMIECQKACFPGIDGGEAGVVERFEKYGGVARPVLHYHATGHTMRRYDRAVNDLPVDFSSQLLSLTGEKDSRIVDRVVHMDVAVTGADAGTYEEYEYIIGSTYYAQEVSKRFWTAEAQKTRDFVRSSTNNTMLAQIRGNAFEDLAHRELTGGGTFRVRNLQTEEEADEIWPERELKQFDALDEIPAIVGDGVDHYGCPLSKRLASVDSVVKDNLLQMTVSLGHPEKVDGLDALLKVMKAERLVFVVPSDKYAEFPAQRYAGEVTQRVRQLQQFVLEIVV